MNHMPVTTPADLLHVDDGGTGGVPVVFIHSFAGTAEHWRKQLDHIRKRRRAVAFDLRGHGQSTVPPADDYSIGSLVDDIDAVAHSLGLEGMVQLGVVTDQDSLGLHLTRTVEPLLEHLELPFARLAQQAAERSEIERLVHLASVYGAMKGTAELRSASLRLGGQRLRLLRELFSHPLLDLLTATAAKDLFQPHATLVAGLQVRHHRAVPGGERRQRHEQRRAAVEGHERRREGHQQQEQRHRERAAVAATQLRRRTARSDPEDRTARAGQRPPEAHLGDGSAVAGDGHERLHAGHRTPVRGGLSAPAPRRGPPVRPGSATSRPSAG